MIKAIIFDLNGVFIQSSRLSDRFKEQFGTPEKDFLSALKKIMTKVRLPNAKDTFSYWQPYLQKWGVNLSKENLFNFWFIAEKEASKMTTLARELKNKGLKIFILSNNFAERSIYYDRNFPFLKEIIDKIYYSWQTGFIKPNIGAYKKVLNENNLKPEECIYFDDTKENVEVATRLGIKSFVFESAEKTKSVLKDYV